MVQAVSEKSSKDDQHVPFAGKIITLRFGSGGRAALPLTFRHVDVGPSQMRIITAEEGRGGMASSCGVELTVPPLTEGNFEAILDPMLKDSDFLLNLSVDKSSFALIHYCWRHGIP